MKCMNVSRDAVVSNRTPAIVVQRPGDTEDTHQSQDPRRAPSIPTGAQAVVNDHSLRSRNWTVGDIVTL